MRHTEIEKRLLLYQEGGLDAPLRAVVSAHLEQCESCRQLLARLSRVYGAPATDAPVAVPGGLYVKVRARWQASQAGTHPAPVRSFRRSPWRLPLRRSLAAALLLLAAIGAGLFLGALPEPAPPVADQGTQLKEVFYTDLFDVANIHSYYQAVEQLYQPSTAEGQ
ncbi:MAG TPA: zf-HC2 domain-containing protein [bacterium]|nr:zf-HC2 domain-containing protein [bacterium]HQG45884.1 zf-HC2 domain-containing protein [bacterium]HQI48340.1 zf-HC2 domain-containing protein [bacterium]HQJ63442.1 zf-HC2 domain-containing protein [bacterium]